MNPTILDTDVISDRDERINYLQRRIDFFMKNCIMQLDDKEIVPSIATVSKARGKKHKRWIRIVDIDGYPFKLTIESTLKREFLR